MIKKSNLILKITDFVNDMMDQLYFTSVDVQNNRWSSRIREKFETVSDYECGGHAALADNNIDYWIWIDGNCFLGDLNYASAVDYDDDVRNDINIYRGKLYIYIFQNKIPQIFL